MAGFTQYIKDTRGELNHVAWPTQTQTIVYTAFVIAISIATALYLGLFDYLFTGTLGRVVEQGGSAPSAVTQPATTSTSAAVPTLSTSTGGTR